MIQNPYWEKKNVFGYIFGWYPAKNQKNQLFGAKNSPMVNEKKNLNEKKMIENSYKSSWIVTREKGKRIIGALV